MRRCALFLLVLSSLAAASAHAQTHANLERGMNAGKAYQVGDVDSVNLFNGSLSIAIPLGQTYNAGGGLPYSFVLRYGSNFWDHDLVTFTNDCTLPYGSITVTESKPHQVASGLNGGIGWSLDFGELKHSGFGQYYDKWTYVSPDGGTHAFYNTMHEGETERVGYRYTRDGSFMRLVASSYDLGGACSAGWLGATIEFADGRRQTFSRLNTCNPFVLNSEIDRFGNSLTFTYEAVNNRWALHDSKGRDHYIGLKGIAGSEYRAIDYVDLAAFDDPGVAGAQRAVYWFNYDVATIARSCKHYYDPWWNSCDPQLLPTVAVPLLTAVTLPDGTQWTMRNGASPGYNLDTDVACRTGSVPKDRPGTLTNLTNPVGGTYNWTYGTWSNPEGASSCYSLPAEGANVKDATGVYDRTLTDPLTGSGGGVWQYRHDSWRLGTGEVDATAQESWTTLTTPEGDQSRHYFRTKYCGTAEEAWDYGLPYTKGRYGTLGEPWVSAEQYDGLASNPSNLRRTSYLRYAKDTLNASWTPSWLQQTNRRVDFEKTVFADDANHFTTTQYSDYDGLGHFRVVTTGGDFGSGNVRQTTTAYNGTLSYPPAAPPADWWSYASPWVINTYTASKVSEGGSVAKTEACFEANTGYLLRTRALKLIGSGIDPARSDGDVVTLRTHTGGDTVREESFGGDTQVVGVGELCSLSLPVPAYRVDHTYQYGSLKTSRYVDSSGAPLSYFLVDRDVDQSTGLVATSRDSAGLATDYVYDLMGRPTWEKPRSSPVNGGAWVQHCYFNAVPPTPARVDNYWWPNGSPQPCGSAATTLRRQAVDVDGFGRTWREYRKIFDGSWAQRLTTYNGLGWTTSLSEWQAYGPPVVKKTEYLNFDPFGRPGTIRPADGSAHDTTLSHTGARLKSRTVNIATAVGVETPSTTTEEYDRQGRLWRVTEPSGSSGANVTTTYGYDVGNRLSLASTTSGVTQNRFFTYDGRGFLTSEQLPEVGPWGNGLVAYSRYDARGHAHRVQDGAHDLAYTFDAGERLTQVAQASAAGDPATPVLKTLTYAAANGVGDWKNGKLESATAHNPDLPNAAVVETFSYAGLGGRVSSRATVVEGRTISQTFGSNDLGQLAALGYPDDAGLGLEVDPGRSVSFTYANGALTAVPEFVSAISYHANGTIDGVLHTNGLQDVFDKDPDDIGRPAQHRLIRASNGSLIGHLGPYAYDGAGNLKTADVDFFTYDQVGRFALGSVSAGRYQQCAMYNAFGGIVRLGTGTSTCFPSPTGVDDATNRLSSPASYDGAGNLTASADFAYGWSRLNQMVATTGSGINKSYAYTADGERVLERDHMTDTATIAIRDLSGKALREYGRSAMGLWTWKKDYVYGDGRLVGSASPSGTRHLHVDYLGSVRVATDTQNPAQPINATIRDYLPFGLDSDPRYATDPERMRFAGQQRDTHGTLTQVDDLDYMHARFYKPLAGRFLSVDPGRDSDPRAPQTWNLYAYARNNPVRFTDPTGLISEDETKKAAQGASASVGAQATNDASVRANYNAQVSQLKQGDPGASAARSAIKAEARLQTSPAGQVVAEAMRPAAGEAARVGGTVAKTNAGVDAAMGVAGKAGPTLLVFGLGVSTYNVATAGNTTRTLAQESGGWLGALSFGVAGAKGGAVLGVVIAGPPGGAVGGVLGGLGGGVAGFFAGEKAATNVYDATTPRP